MAGVYPKPGEMVSLLYAHCYVRTLPCVQKGANFDGMPFVCKRLRADTSLC